MTVGIIGGNWDSGNWVKLYNEKRQDSSFISVLVSRRSERQWELQASLSIKKNELEQRNTLVKADSWLVLSQQ